MIPSALREKLNTVLPAPMVSGSAVSGGSINRAAKIVLEDRTTCFVKWNATADPEMFEKEKRGLQLLASAGTSLRIPHVLATGKVNRTGFLVQEYVEEGRGQSQSASQFGEALADLHQHHADHHGLNYDNFIGRLPQSNERHDNWIDFFIEERLKPQLQMAVDREKLDSAIIGSFNHLYRKLPEIFPGLPPSLLHGDLWGGNYMYDTEGNAVIYDPAVYYGNREIELAFTHLFGGFSAGFYEAYHSANPLPPGFQKRKDIYNLYPLLVHVNLFGGSYSRQVKSIIRRFR